jgi:hypothetical protein
MTDREPSWDTEECHSECFLKAGKHTSDAGMFILFLYNNHESLRQLQTFSDFKIQVFWDMTPCRCVGGASRRIEGMLFFHLQGQVFP